MQLNVGAKNTGYDKILNLLLQIFCVLLPFEEALSGSFGSVVKLIGVAIILYVIIIYRKIIIHRYNYILIAWIVLAALSFFWSKSYYWWLWFFKIYASQTVFLLVVTGVPKYKISLRKIRKALMLGAFLASIILIFFPQNSLLSDDGRRTIIMFGHRFDPNILSAVILLGVASAFNEAFGSLSIKRRCVYVALILLYFVGIFFTGSRGGLISTVITSAVFLLFETKKRQNRKLVWIIIAIAALAFIITVPILPSSLLESRFSKSAIFGLNELNAGVHNRYSIWESALKLIPDRLLFGYGIGNFLTAIKKVYFRSCASHNLFLLLVVETGIIGFLMFITFLIYLLNKLRKSKQYETYAMMIGILTISLTLDALPFKYFWVGLIYAELTINIGQNDTRLVS